MDAAMVIRLGLSATRLLSGQKYVSKFRKNLARLGAYRGLLAILIVLAMPKEPYVFGDCERRILRWQQGRGANPTCGELTLGLQRILNKDEEQEYKLGLLHCTRAEYDAACW
jgi:hypothetical protein